jgi:carboxylate-amine ligase
MSWLSSGSRPSIWVSVDVMRTMGVEEELLLVNPDSGRPVAVAPIALATDATTDEGPSHGAPTDGPPQQAGDPERVPGNGGTVGPELQQQQVEIDTPPRDELAKLANDLRSWRSRADDRARKTGSRAVALATSPLVVRPQTTPKTRYLKMAQRFGITAQEQLTCGCHVHVSVDSAAEGVGILDRIRTWLPTLIALSANSPYWQGRDTGYSSFRVQAWQRWPSAGPIEVLGTEQSYRALVSALIATGAVMDEGMIYFDARLSARYSTVEVRVADVCLEVDDAVLLAGLIRALVDTASREWQQGVPAARVPAVVLRAQAWQASRAGLRDSLVHPVEGEPRPAPDVLWDLFAHARAALVDNGDEETVGAGLARLLSRGNGADRQRAVYERTGTLSAVVSDALDLTHTS